jgi:hypothetical protein
MTIQVHLKAGTHDKIYIIRLVYNRFFLNCMYPQVRTKTFVNLIRKDFYNMYVTMKEKKSSEIYLKQNVESGVKHHKP